MALCIALAACAPTIEGPAERQRDADRSDGDQLARQLGALPGAISAHVTIHRAVRDPIAVGTVGSSTAAILVIVDDRADRSSLTTTATKLVRAALPEIAAPELIVEVGARRPVLASVGPFSVEQASERPLRAVLGGALVAIALLAAWIAYRERALAYLRGNKPQ